MKIIDGLKNWDHTYLIIVLCILILTVFLSKLSVWIVNRSLRSASEKSKTTPTHHHFFKNAITLILWVFALIAIAFVIPQLRAFAITLFASAGVLFAILGLASQQALSNIASGIFIVIFKPFGIGDFVSIAGKYTGTIEDITLRHTVITNFENRRVIIPNSIISTETVINSSKSDEKICEPVVFDISYESDTNLAIKILREEAELHRYSIDNRTRKEKKQGLDAVSVFVMGFGESSVKLKARVWCVDPIKAYDMHYDLNLSVKDRFESEGIEIPYPHRTILYKKHSSIEKTD